MKNAIAKFHAFGFYKLLEMSGPGMSQPKVEEYKVGIRLQADLARSNATSFRTKECGILQRRTESATTKKQARSLTLLRIRLLLDWARIPAAAY